MIVKAVTGMAMMAATIVAPSSADPAGAQAAPPFDWDDTADIQVQGTPTMVDLDGIMPGHAPDDRLWDVTMVTESIFVPGANPAPPPAVDPVHIDVTTRVYLPEGYDHAAQGGYPVLYLLHGGAGAFQDWSTPPGVVGASCGNVLASGGGDITTILESPAQDFITVLVEGGCAGWYSDWRGETDGHFRPLWETFHTEELIPWVDANLNTQENAAGRVIAGVSMGGLGAMRYAAHHPDLFSTAGSFSGAVDMRFEPFQDTVSLSMVGYGATVNLTGLGMTEYRMTPGGDSEQEETARLAALFGAPLNPTDPDDPADDEVAWPTENPTELAGADAFDAYDLNLAVYSGGTEDWDGDGLDSPGETGDAANDGIESDEYGETDIGIINQRFHQALNNSGVTHRYCYGPGQHEFDDWRPFLTDFVAYAFGGSAGACPNVP